MTRSVGDKATDSRARSVDTLARTLLYEGYALYPYRASSLKNRRPSLLGAVMAGDAIEVEVLFEGSIAEVRVEARWLELRRVEREGAPAWHSAEERTLSLATTLAEIETDTAKVEARAADALLSAKAIVVSDSIHRVRVRLDNLAARGGDDATGCLAAAHLVISADRGAFVSSIDPPERFIAAASTCASRGLFPVLVGDGGRDLVLASPFAIGDHPQVAAESPGDLFDATEIDEILTLRILTMTEDEKQEARATDPRILALLDRTFALDAERLAKLHGARREPLLGAGSRVRLNPKRRADVFDLALAGRAATITGIERDFEGRTYFTVTVDDDPGKDLGELGQVGHRFFFDTDEVEPLSREGDNA